MAAKNRSDYGGSAYDQQYFTDDELESAYNIRKAAEEGTTSWDDAHDYVEALRNNYGYSGGDDGSGYNKADTGTYTYTSPRPSYTDTYSDQINSLADDILNRKDFSYDTATDPAYQAYAKEYTTKGQQAMQDTLGQVSARTGGLASSYAGTASQQAYDNYMQQLSDEVPELYTAAYNRYLDELSNKRSDLSALEGLSDTAYNRYADALSQYDTDRSYNYGLYSDKQTYDLNKQSEDASNGWEALTNGIMPDDDHMTAMGINESEAQDILTKASQSTNYSKLATEITNYGYQPSEQEIADAGMTDGEYQAMYASWYASAYADTSSSSSSSGGRSSGSSSSKSSSSGYDNGDLSEEQVKTLQEYYGVDADGKWGSNSKLASGGKTANSAWTAYLKSGSSTSDYAAVVNYVGNLTDNNMRPKEVLNYINGVYNSGKITYAQYQTLEGLYEDYAANYVDEG